jgi:hypothetical protein
VDLPYLIPYPWDPWDPIYGCFPFDDELHCAVPGSNCSEALDGILGIAMERMEETPQNGVFEWVIYDNIW